MDWHRVPRLRSSSTPSHCRLVLTDYAGPRKKLTLEQAVRLGSGWGAQVKLDGMYARVTTDTQGRISRILARSGRPVSFDLVGLAIGLPDAVLHGELEASTEAGIRAAETRGWGALHVFDTSRWCGRDVSHRGAAVRHDLLRLWQDGVRDDDVPDRDWWRTDVHGDAHHPETGRYVRPVPQDLRRVPLVELHTGRGAVERLWDDHVGAGGEGLVVVNLDAPLGKRGSKAKVKQADELDAVVVEVGRRAAKLVWRGHAFLVPCRSWAPKLRPGTVVSVSYDGWFESSVVPKFPRITRVRVDLA